MAVASPIILAEACRQVHSAADPCAFIHTHCTDIGGLVNYLDVYYCQLPELHWLALLLILGWLLFLFTWVGISASDYFSPNLTVLAKYFSIPDSLAGVTLLALGNGAPDLFSTFSALKSGSGALALGELVGAASFIACVVTGMMIILYPFKVAVVPFLREVIFFTLTLSVTTWISWDRKITLWEGVALVGFYVTYVVVVMISTWMERKYLARRSLVERARAEYIDWGVGASSDAWTRAADYLSTPFAERPDDGDFERVHVRRPTGSSDAMAPDTATVVTRTGSGWGDRSTNGPPAARPGTASTATDAADRSTRGELVPLIPKASYSSTSDGAGPSSPHLSRPPSPSPPAEAAHEDLIQPNVWIRRKSILSAIEFRDFLQSLPGVSYRMFTQATPVGPRDSPRPEERSPGTFPVPWDRPITPSRSNAHHNRGISHLTLDAASASPRQGGPCSPVGRSPDSRRSVSPTRPRHHRIDIPRLEVENYEAPGSSQSSSPPLRPGLPQLVVHPSTPRSQSRSLLHSHAADGGSQSSSARGSLDVPRSDRTSTDGGNSDNGGPYQSPSLRPRNLAVSIPPRGGSSRSLLSVDSALLTAISPRSVDNAEAAPQLLTSRRSRGLDRSDSQRSDQSDYFSMSSNSPLAPLLRSRAASPAWMASSHRPGSGRSSQRATPLGTPRPPSSPALSGGSRTSADRFAQAFAAAVPLPIERAVSFCELSLPRKAGAVLLLFMGHLIPTIRSWHHAHLFHRLFIFITAPIILALNMTVPISAYPPPPLHHLHPNDAANAASPGQGVGSPAKSDRPADEAVVETALLCEDNLINFTRTDALDETNNGCSSGSDSSEAGSVRSHDVLRVTGTILDDHQLQRYNHLAKQLVMTLRCLTIPLFVAAADLYIFQREAWWMVYLAGTLGLATAVLNALLAFPLLRHPSRWWQCLIRRFDRSGYDYTLLAEMTQSATPVEGQRTTAADAVPRPRHSQSIADPPVWPLPSSLAGRIVDVYHSTLVRSLGPAVLGFLAGMSWVYLTADEVVAILQSVGVVLNISDGILGLTVLALGNSLGDFMTDLTIARMGLPAMALSACFGGPMLNILLGIGISATTITSATGHSYPLPVSNTVFVSALGVILCMILMLVWVPLNNFHMTRGLGAILIAVYFLCMGINLILEYHYEQRHDLT